MNPGSWHDFFRLISRPGACACRIIFACGLALLAAAAPARIFSVREHGAAGDGKTTDTAAINKTIEACAAAGGGEVRFPAGTYLSGTVRLRSNVTLNFAEGARLVGTPDLTQYRQFTPPSAAPELRFGKWGRALILGERVSNVTITGPGTIDGNRVFDPTGEEHRRGPHTILLGLCQGVTICDVTIRDSANYAMLLEESSQVTARHVTVTGGWDGFHFRGLADQPCRDLRVENCIFKTGDDSIAGRYAEGVMIQNCTINSACNGVRIIGPVKNMTLENCAFYGPGEQPHRSSDRTNMLSGIILQPGGWDASPGAMEDVRISSVTMKNVASPLTIYCKRPGNTIDRITIERLTATGVYRAPLSVECWSPGSKIGTITLRDAAIEYDGGAPAKPARLEVRPPGVDCRPLPAWGVYMRDGGRLVLDNVRLSCKQPSPLPVIKTEGANRLELDGVTYPSAAQPSAALSLSSATQVLRQGK